LISYLIDPCKYYKSPETNQTRQPVIPLSDKPLQIKSYEEIKPQAVVLDSNNNFHGVLVDAGNGKVLASTQMSMGAMMQMGMMGPGMMGFRYDRP